jgi:hypothetical protein
MNDFYQILSPQKFCLKQIVAFMPTPDFSLSLTKSTKIQLRLVQDYTIFYHDAKGLMGYDLLIIEDL